MIVQYFAESVVAIKKVEVQARVAAAVPDAAMGEADYQRVMKELAVYASSHWTLKSGEHDDV